ncbi:unnamed protein product, partial [marine sediment metagenome]
LRERKKEKCYFKLKTMAGNHFIIMIKGEMKI